MFRFYSVAKATWHREYAVTVERWWWWHSNMTSCAHPCSKLFENSRAALVARVYLMFSISVKYYQRFVMHSESSVAACTNKICILHGSAVQHLSTQMANKATRRKINKYLWVWIQAQKKIYLAACRARDMRQTTNCMFMSIYRYHYKNVWKHFDNFANFAKCERCCHNEEQKCIQQFVYH